MPAEEAGGNGVGPTSVLLVDDHALLRKTLATTLSSWAGLQLIGEACDGLEAVEQARALQPDVVVMDLHMPRSDGFEATRRIKAELPTTRVLILTSSEEEEIVFEALRSGAHGYVAKSRIADDLRYALESLAREEACLPAPMARRVLVFLTSEAGNGDRPDGLGAEISEQERALLTLLGQGIPPERIAAQHGLSTAAIGKTLYDVLSKVHMHTCH